MDAEFESAAAMLTAVFADKALPEVLEVDFCGVLRIVLEPCLALDPYARGRRLGLTVDERMK